MIAELLTRARFTPHAAARYLGVSLQTVRRYLRRDQAPKATIEALRRAPWYSPETVEYLEKLAAIKALEITRRAAAPVMVSMHRPLMGPAVWSRSRSGHSTGYGQSKTSRQCPRCASAS